MLLRTHIMFAIFMIILFMQQVENQFLFILMVLVATIIPDLDSGFSSYGRHMIFRPLQFFVKHRGIIHSFSAAVLLSVLLAVFYPILSFGFFIGYSVHLICDSFTREGIQPFWPLKVRSSGFIRTGGKIEESLFFSLIFVDIIMFFIFVVLG
ncbi:metal-dependent hydrolase [archaeon]|jgi:membrane-bound metal-dependent hydrolase YbcI (DUF457 family)|nr:metal-dependent hydrolase [archaeon]MBT4241744.1 metal-dependent hydrolase [archaeon]MBT4418292.1 metal-dependent hydrolase [archaeon]